MEARNRHCQGNPMKYHTVNGVSVSCYLESSNSCRLCELLDPANTVSYATSYATIVSPSGADPSSWTPPPARPGTPVPAASLLAGDLVELAAKRMGADRLAEWLAMKLTGVPDCGCESRRVKLNEIDVKLRKWLGIGVPK